MMHDSQSMNKRNEQRNDARSKIVFVTFLPYAASQLNNPAKIKKSRFMGIIFLA